MLNSIFVSFQDCLGWNVSEEFEAEAEERPSLENRLARKRPGAYECSLPEPDSKRIDLRQIKCHTSKATRQVAPSSSQVAAPQSSGTVITVADAMSLISGLSYYSITGFGLLGGLSKDEIRRITSRHSGRTLCMECILENINLKGPLTKELLASFLFAMENKSKAQGTADRLGFSLESGLLPDCEKSADGNPDRPLSVLEVALFFSNRGLLAINDYVDVAVELGVPPECVNEILYSATPSVEKRIALFHAIKERGQLTVRKLYNAMNNYELGETAGFLARAWGLTEQPRVADFAVYSSRKAEALNQAVSFRDLNFYVSNMGLDRRVIAAALDVNDRDNAFSMFDVLNRAFKDLQVETVNDLVKLLYKRPLDCRHKARLISSMVQGDTAEEHCDLRTLYTAFREHALTDAQIRNVGYHLGISDCEMALHVSQRNCDWQYAIAFLADRKGLLTGRNLVYALKQSGEQRLLSDLRKKKPELKGIIKGERQLLNVPYLPEPPVFATGQQPVSLPLTRAHFIQLPPHNWFLLGLTLGIPCKTLHSIEYRGSDPSQCMCLLADKLMSVDIDYETGHLWLALQRLQDDGSLAELPDYMKVEPSILLKDLTEFSGYNLEQLRLAESLKKYPKNFANQLDVELFDTKPKAPGADLRRIVEIHHAFMKNSVGDEVAQVRDAERYCLTVVAKRCSRSSSNRKSRRTVPYRR